MQRCFLTRKKLPERKLLLVHQILSGTLLKVWPLKQTDKIGGEVIPDTYVLHNSGRHTAGADHIPFFTLTAAGIQHVNQQMRAIYEKTSI